MTTMRSRNLGASLRRSVRAAVLAVAVSCGVLRAETDWTTLPFDALLRDACRGGDGELARARAHAARNEVYRRGPDALRELVARAHIRNTWIPILVDQLWHKLDEAAAADALLEGLDSPHARTRRLCVYQLGIGKTPVQVDRVRALLADEDVRAVAIRTLGKWKVREAVPALTPFLADEREVVRVAAVNALREIGDPAAAPALLGALEDPVFTVRFTAIGALAALGPEVEDAVIERLDAGAGPERLLVRTLGAMGATGQVGRVRARLASDDPWVRGEAVRALQALDPAGAAAWCKDLAVDADPFVRSAVQMAGAAQEQPKEKP